jgi:hypothetical protein
MNINVTQSLYETLQAAFLLEGKRLCKDIATILGQDEKELQKKLLKAKIPITLFNDSERCLSCLVVVQKDHILARCRKPCILGTNRCISHQAVETIEDPSADLKQYTRVESNSELDEPLWCHEETGALINSKGKQVGTYEDEVISLWQFEKEA